VFGLWSANASVGNIFGALEVKSMNKILLSVNTLFKQTGSKHLKNQEIFSLQFSSFTC